MNKTSPIRNRHELDNFAHYYLRVKPNPRNHLLITLGLNTAMRISDILSLTWSQIYDFKWLHVRSHLLAKEKALGVNGMKVDGADDTNAKDAIETIKQALQKVSDQRSSLGAVQNRLEHT